MEESWNFFLVIFMSVFVLGSILWTIINGTIFFKWLIAKDSYYYYWRYWNPFTFVFKKRFTQTWFIRFFFPLFFIVMMMLEFDSIKLDLTLFLIFICLLIFYASCTYYISNEDGGESSVLIREAKRYYGRLESKDSSRQKKYYEQIDLIDDINNTITESKNQRLKEYKSKIKKKENHNSEVIKKAEDNVLQDMPTNITALSDDLIKLGELKEKGLLTEEEFNEQKKKLLKQ